MLDKEYKLVQIRYNTESDGIQVCWRLILDGKEHLVNNVVIEVPSCTTRDWIPDKQVYKHHITITNCKVVIDEDQKARIFV